jgi:hypothetical protein
MADAHPTEPRAGRAHLRPLPTPEVDTSDWPAQAADTIERTVQSVRDKTTGPAITAARWLVAGLAAMILGTAALVLTVIALVRLLDAYLPDAWFGEQHVWAAHLTLGTPLFLGGVYCLRKARRTKDPDDGS